MVDDHVVDNVCDYAHLNDDNNVKMLTSTSMIVMTIIVTMIL